MTKKVSIVISSKNCQDTITKCLQSVLEQTYGRENIEIILVDSSTDKTVELAQPFIDKLIQTPPEKGLAYAMGRGMLEAEGDYLMSLDADSYISKDWIEKAIGTLKNPHISIVGSYIAPSNSDSFIAWAFALNWNAMNKPTGNAMMFRAADYGNTGGYCPIHCTVTECNIECDYSRYEDKVLLAKLSEIGEPIVMIDVFLYTELPNTTQKRWLCITGFGIASLVTGTLVIHDITAKKTTGWTALKGGCSGVSGVCAGYFYAKERR